MRGFLILGMAALFPLGGSAIADPLDEPQAQGRLLWSFDTGG